MVATPIQRGAGVIMSLVRADGLVIIPRFSEGLDAGQEVMVELLRSPESLDGTIVAIGSHDLTLDLLASELRRGHPNLTLTSSNVGSLVGSWRCTGARRIWQGRISWMKRPGNTTSPSYTVTCPGGARRGQSGAPHPGLHRAAGQSQVTSRRLLI